MHTLFIRIYILRHLETGLMRVAVQLLAVKLKQCTGKEGTAESGDNSPWFVTTSNLINIIDSNLIYCTDLR